MNTTNYQILITLIASAISGITTAQYGYRKNKKDKAAMQADKAHDLLLIEVKDLQIKLYKLEKDLTEWKEKYFEALQELIKVKAELEGTMVKLSHVEIHNNED
jgi:hypothetical protein